MSFLKNVIGAVGDFAKTGVGSFGTSLLTGGISSLAQGAIGSLFNRSNANYSNNLAQQNAQYWAQYNSPINQMQRLKEAGLNPNLVYGNGSAVATADGNSTAPNVEGVKFNWNAPAQAALLKAEKDNKNKQNELLDSQINKTNQEAEGLAIANRTAGERYQAELNNMRETFYNLQKQGRLFDAESSVKEADATLKRFQSRLNDLYGIDNAYWENIRIKSAALIEQLNATYAPKLKELEVKFGVQKINKLISDICLNKTIQNVNSELATKYQKEGKVLDRQYNKLGWETRTAAHDASIARIEKERADFDFVKAQTEATAEVIAAYADAITKANKAVQETSNTINGDYGNGNLNSSDGSNETTVTETYKDKKGNVKSSKTIHTVSRAAKRALKRRGR